VEERLLSVDGKVPTMLQDLLEEFANEHIVLTRQDQEWFVGYSGHPMLVWWPYPRLLFLCPSCDSLHEVTLDKVPEGEISHLLPGSALVPDLGQPALKAVKARIGLTGVVEEGAVDERPESHYGFHPN
jgi:hypothetical protein